MEHVEPERDVKLLLEKHAALIAEVRAALKDELSEAEAKCVDEIFVLRYVLSYKTAESALKYLRGGLEYRRNNPWLALALQGKPHPRQAEVTKYTCADYHGCKVDGGPIQVIRAGLINLTGLYDNNEPTLIVEEMTMKKEEAWLVCDKVTRETGRLTKQIVIVDFANLGWFVPSQVLISSQNDASAIAKMLYPQLLEKVIIINAPWFMSQLWKVATMVLSESLTGKAAFCGGTIAPGELSKCPYASANVKPEVLPSFVGGTCDKCVPGCIGGVPNVCTTIKASDEVAPQVQDAPPQEESSGGGGGWFSSLW